MANPLILFENIFEDGTVTQTSEASGFPIENALDWRIGTPFRWKATSTALQNIEVDLGVGVTAQPTAIVIGGHNLGTESCTYKVLADSSTPPGNTILAATAAADDLPVISTWSTPTAYRYWRVQISAASANPVQIGALTLGRRIDWEAGPLPDFDAYGFELESEGTRSENGAFLGTNVITERRDFRMSYTEIGMTRDSFFAPAAGISFDTDFLPHVKAGKPFWFTWNIDVDTDQTFLCKTTEIRMPFIGSTKRRGLSATFAAYREIA